CIGQLTDALRDANLSVAVRAQLPTVIVAAASDRARAELARAGLVADLSDPELDVRCAIAEGLARLRDVHPELVVDDELVFAGVRRELEHTTHTPKTLKHLATLLALALPSEAIQMAFLGMSSEDPTLRGVSLEYLENVLPTDIREQMWKTLAIEVSEAATAARRPLEDVLAELLRSKREQTLHETQVDLSTSASRSTPP
ncbi:MAG: hypothetical protein H0T65_25545, partial [Deltaproteobacteria bacterium]|nr:hypothetical protein [Deltaproteobacteria bacterium]